MDGVSYDCACAVPSNELCIVLNDKDQVDTCMELGAQLGRDVGCDLSNSAGTSFAIMKESSFVVITHSWMTKWII